MHATPGLIELPAVVDAADRVVLDPTKMQRRAAMRAAVGNDPRRARLPAIERVILAHDANGLGVPGWQILRTADRLPEPAHEYAAGSSRARGGDVDVGGLLRTAHARRRTRFHKRHR